MDLSYIRQVESSLQYPRMMMYGFFAVYLLLTRLTRRENRNRLSGSRISISSTKSVIESRSSTRSSARLVVPKITYLRPGLLGTGLHKFSRRVSS